MCAAMVVSPARLARSGQLKVRRSPSTRTTPRVRNQGSFGTGSAASARRIGPSKTPGNANVETAIVRLKKLRREIVARAPQ